MNSRGRQVPDFAHARQKQAPQSSGSAVDSMRRAAPSRHGAISFVTPAQRHAGLDAGLLNVRKAVYETARQANPNRWSKDTRSWHYKCAVHLNPDSAESKEPNTALKTA